jgi:hypothetical protein
LENKWDIIVWFDEDDDVVCKAYTDMGQDFMRMLFEGIRGDETVEILMNPDEFVARVGDTLNVGFKSPQTGIIHPMREKFLH